MKWRLKQHTPFSAGLWQEVAARNCFHRQGNVLRLHLTVVEGGLSQLLSGFCSLVG